MVYVFLNYHYYNKELLRNPFREKGCAFHCHFYNQLFCSLDIARITIYLLHTIIWSKATFSDTQRKYECKVAIISVVIWIECDLCDDLCCWLWVLRLCFCLTTIKRNCCCCWWWVFISCLWFYDCNSWLSREMNTNVSLWKGKLLRYIEKLGLSTVNPTYKYVQSNSVNV